MGDQTQAWILFSLTSYDFFMGFINVYIEGGGRWALSIWPEATRGYEPCMLQTRQQLRNAHAQIAGNSEVQPGVTQA